MSFRAVAMDIDGTITDDNLLISPDAINGIRRLKELGLEVIVCSGNVLPIVYAISFYTGARGPVVAENGGVIYHNKEVRALTRPDEAIRAFEHLKERMEVRRLFTDRWRESEVGFYQDNIDVEDIKEALKGYDVLVETSGFAIHLMPGNITKMDGIRALEELTGISPDEMIAIGDGDNDSAMIEGCGYGIALRNASKKARESADFVTEKEHGEGFMQAVRHIERMIEGHG